MTRERSERERERERERDSVVVLCNGLRELQDMFISTPSKISCAILTVLRSPSAATWHLKATVEPVFPSTEARLFGRVSLSVLGAFTGREHHPG